MSSSSNNIATLSDVKVKLSEDETEWEHVQVRDKHVVHSKLLEACLTLHISCSKLMLDRFASICDNGTDLVKEAICLGILYYENYDEELDRYDLGNSEAEWDIALSSILDRFFGLL